MLYFIVNFIQKYTNTINITKICAKNERSTHLHILNKYEASNFLFKFVYKSIFVVNNLETVNLC